MFIKWKNNVLQFAAASLLARRVHERMVTPSRRHQDTIKPDRRRFQLFFFLASERE